MFYVDRCTPLRFGMAVQRLFVVFALPLPPLSFLESMRSDISKPIVCALKRTFQQILASDAWEGFLESGQASLQLNQQVTHGVLCCSYRYFLSSARSVHPLSPFHFIDLICTARIPWGDCLHHQILQHYFVMMSERFSLFGAAPVW